MKIDLTGMALTASLLILLAGGCASSSSTLVQPAETSHMKSTVGTPDELSPLAPPEARNIRKVGNQWKCDLGGQTMIYNGKTAQWEAQKK